MGADTLRFLCLSFVLISSVQAATIRLDADSEQLYIVGQIVPGDYDRFVTAIRQTANPITAVNIVSVGGNVQDAVKIGRLIRKLNLATNAPNLASYAPQARALVCGAAAKIAASPCTCASACFLIWAAGVTRSGTDIHIHRISFDATYYGSLQPGDASAQYRTGIEEVHRYLSEMEIPESIYERMVRMPSYGAELLDPPTTTTLTWPPSFGEWLNARCGGPRNPNFGMCTLQQQWQASAAAIQKFRAGN